MGAMTPFRPGQVGRALSPTSLRRRRSAPAPRSRGRGGRKARVVMLRLGLILAAGILAADQASKHYMLFVLHLPIVGHIPLVEIGPFGFDLTMVWNRGVTFGLLSGDAAWTQFALGAVALVIAGLLLRWMARAENRATALALGAEGSAERPHCMPPLARCDRA